MYCLSPHVHIYTLYRTGSFNEEANNTEKYTLSENSEVIADNRLFS